MQAQGRNGLDISAKPTVRSFMQVPCSYASTPEAHIFMCHLVMQTFMICMKERLCQSQVLFFSRLLADVCGRTVPRVRALAVHSRMSLFALGCFMTASIPGYLYYIKASSWHSDWAITGTDPHSLRHL